MSDNEAETDAETFGPLTRAQLVKYMHDEEDKENVLEEFSQVLKSIPHKLIETVPLGMHETKGPSYKKIYQNREMRNRAHGTVLQDAVLYEKQDFVACLLKHGFNPLAVVEVNEETPEMDWDYYETDVTSLTAVEIAFLVKQVDLIALLGQHAELSKDQTLNYVELMMRAKKEVSVEEFRKRVMSLPVDEVELKEKKIEFHRDNRGLHESGQDCTSSDCDSDCYCDDDDKTVRGTWIQFLATMERKVDMLAVLLDIGLDPNAVHLPSLKDPDKCNSGCSALEIAAMTGNIKAFKLLAPLCNDQLKKKFSLLVLLGLADSAPTDHFKTIFASIPLEELECADGTLEDHILLMRDEADKEVEEALDLWRQKGRWMLERQLTRGHVQGASLLQIFAIKGRTPYVKLLLEQGFDPEQITRDESEPPLELAWRYQHYATVAELIRYVEPGMSKRSSEYWRHVEKERDKMWQMEMLNLVKEQTKILANILKV